MKLARNQNITGLFGVLLLAFGITDLNFESLVFENNEKAYICIFFGLFLGFMFLWSRLRN